ncbi:MAG: hypothetical protein DRH90_16805 [Deltaproteobacteria bacterium]|nr:MAG: hypothetical protein DRH90_16805 [Deltaproteobacteria bacterium]
MNRLKRQLSLWTCCTLLVLPFIMTSPSYAQCTMTSEQLDKVVASCGSGDLDCFVSLAKDNMPCAANIAWYFMIMNAPDDPNAVLKRFLSAVPYSYTLEKNLKDAVHWADIANRNEQKAGSETSANEYPYGQ